MQALLDTLNEAQKEAVLDFEKPLLVLAGAGSGKTRVITSKIAYAIKEMNYSPYRILAVTFTNKAAKEMRNRINSMIPDENTSGLEMRTFHSFGAYVLRRYGSKIGLNDSFTIYDDEDSLNLLANAFPDEKKSNLREYMKQISKAKDKGYNPDSKELNGISYHMQGFRTYFRVYENALRKSGCVDFADLITRTTELLRENPDVKEYFQSRYKLILVDEYQDTNTSQFMLLKQIVGPETQLVVVGDDDQSIYKFRGAEIRNILSFEFDYPNTRIIKLEENYRSTKNILRVAYSVIKNNKGRHDKTIFTNNEQGELPEIINSLDSNEEAFKVRLLLSRLPNYKSVAILYRTNAQSREFETELSRNRIPYQVVGALRFYEREEIKDSLALFSLILNPHDRISFLRIINKPARGIGKSALEQILSYSDHLIDSLEFAIKDNKLSAKAKNGANNFLAMYKKGSELINTGCELKDFATFMLDESGLKRMYEEEKDEAIRRGRLENLSALISALDKLPSGRDGLISFLESITLDRTTLGDEEKDEENSVKLMTMHNTKGLEFDTVFVTGLEDGIMPSVREDSQEEDVEEERRLFYVALTRARKNLFLTYSSKRMLWGSWNSQKPSRFLKEIPKEFYKGAITSLNATFTNHFAFEPRKSTYSNTPSWAKNIVTTPTKLKNSDVKVKKNVNYEVGDSVISPDYGRGEVISKEIKNDKTVIRVKFANGNTALFNTLYANLTKVD